MPWEHRSLVISSSLADEADLLIDEKPVPPTGIDFYHREPRIVSLRPKNNSPVAGLPVALKRLIIEGLRPQDLRSEPPFDGFQTDHRWTVTGVSGAGTFRLSLAGESMSSELDAPNCRLRSERPSLRFYYANAGQYAPLPPEVVNLRVNAWYGVDLKLMHADGSPIDGATATIYRPEKEPVSGRTNVDGIMLGFPAFQYTTPSARTFEAVATSPSGEVARATYLINVQS
ncbi:Carboxypeptidase regulatory-like domain-containing protein [Pseudomonas sp. IT-196MI5]